MTTPRVETDNAPPQDVVLGEINPTPGARLSLHDHGDRIILQRHRFNTYADGSSFAARVTVADGAVTDIAWDDWHRKCQPVWMSTVEDWIRETIEAS